MNDRVRQVIDQIELPADLCEAVRNSVETRRSVNMNKRISKKAVIVIAAVICVVLLCAAGWPLLRISDWGESAVAKTDGNGSVMGVEQSAFDPAYYRPQGIINRVYMPTCILDDPEAEIMTVFDELSKLETSPFTFYEDGSEIGDIGSYRLAIGDSIRMEGSWSEFTLTREDENKFTLLDSENCGFNYYIYPMTGDNFISLDYTPNGVKTVPENIIKIENNSKNFTLESGDTAVIGSETATYKKGDRIRFTVRFGNVSDEALGSSVYLGYYLNPSDPAGETEGPGYQTGDSWSYPLAVPLDGYCTVLEYPLSLSGEYRFCISNLFGDLEFEVESFSAEVIPAE